MDELSDTTQETSSVNYESYEEESGSESEGHKEDDI